MNENSVVCADFPHTESVPLELRQPPGVVLHQLSVVKINDWAQHIEFLACAKLFASRKENIQYREIFGPDRSQKFMRPRRWIWWVLRNHPDLRISWPVIGDRYNRHHSTILNAVRTFHLQMLAGYLGDEMAAVQWILDALESDGFTPATVSEVGL